MMSVLNPEMCTRLALQYSIALIPLCSSLYMIDIFGFWFAVDSTIANLALVYYAIHFHQDPTAKSAKSLFFASLIHLPVLMVLIVLHRVFEERVQRKVINVDVLTEEASVIE